MNLDDIDNMVKNLLNSKNIENEEDFDEEYLILSNEDRDDFLIEKANKDKKQKIIDNINNFIHFLINENKFSKEEIVYIQSLIKQIIGNKLQSGELNFVINKVYEKTVFCRG